MARSEARSDHGGVLRRLRIGLAQAQERLGVEAVRERTLHHVFDPRLESEGVHRQNDLVRDPLRTLGEDGPQRFVTLDDVDEGLFDDVGVDLPRHPDHERKVVGSGSRIELVEEPHPLLRERQRDPFGPLLRHQRDAVIGVDVLGHPGRQPLDGGRLEHHPDRYRRPEGRTDPGGVMLRIEPAE